MFCTKCGKAIPDGSSACPICQANLSEKSENEQAIVYSSAKMNDMAIERKITKRKISKKVIWIISIIFAVLAVLFTVNEIQKSHLKNELLRDWKDVDDSIIKVLDFSNDEVEYKLETGYSWMDSTLGTYDYKIISGNKIKIKRFGKDYDTFTIEFNDDKSMITVTPAITSTDASETWFNFD